jgi:hypothetical protein
MIIILLLSCDFEEKYIYAAVQTLHIYVCRETTFYVVMNATEFVHA